MVVSMLCQWLFSFVWLEHRNKIMSMVIFPIKCFLPNFYLIIFFHVFLSITFHQRSLSKSLLLSLAIIVPTISNFFLSFHPNFLLKIQNFKFRTSRTPYVLKCCCPVLSAGGLCCLSPKGLREAELFFKNYFFVSKNTNQKCGIFGVYLLKEPHMCGWCF